MQAENGDAAGALEKLEHHLGGERPDPEAFHLAAILHEEQGRISRAVELYGLALRQSPDDPRFNFKLGKNLARLSEHESALKCLRKATLLHPAMVVARSHMGLAMEGMGDFQAAFDEHMKALEIDPRLTTSRRGLVSLLGGRKLKLGPSPLLRKALEYVFAADDIDLAPVSRKASAQLRWDHGLSLSPAGGVWQPPDAVARDPLFLSFLTSVVNQDPLMESYLTACRAWFLKAYVRGGLKNNQAELLAALAGQCFINSHVFFAGEPEKKLADILWGKAGACLPKVPADYFNLVVCALYRPLHGLPLADDLAKWPLEAWPRAFRDIIRRSLVEPCAERIYASRLADLGKSGEATSLEVGARYEESPYPRWVRLPPLVRRGLLEDLAAWGADTAKLEGQRPLKALVAGCGTGRGALSLALCHPELDIVALDLSRASLGYAMRKSRDACAANLRFVRGDILQAGSFGEKFHYIDCIGVLHHMAEPVEGWRELSSLLPSGGVMKLGLYSRAARRNITALKKAMGESGMGSSPGDVRDFRRSLMMAQDAKTLGDLLNFRDFYNLDECRDLLFHPMEHCFDLPGIRRGVKEAGLKFVNFLGVDHKEFRRETKAETGDLAAWGEYENRHPDIFRGMYIFLCQKP